MKLTCVLATNFRGDPAIKITKDCPQATFDIYCEDLNLIKSLEGKELTLSFKEE